jgi:arylsulfatase A-like enzyme
MKTFLAALAALGLACAVSPRAAAAQTSPNFVIIFIDDMGYGDIGPFGATKQKTPQLDRMAREGMRLTSFYAAPVCSVSRAQLMTGCYGVRVSVPGVYFPGGRNGLHTNEFTVAERLKERGYATAMVGKWHLGDQPEFLPVRQGFDRYLGVPYSNDMQRKRAGGGERVLPLLRDDKVAEFLTDEQQRGIVARYTDEAVSFIREKKDGPFVLYLAHNAIHTPVFPGTNFAGRSNNGRVGDWIEEVDWSVGRVLETLRELRLAENTLVVFTSDNGPWLSKGRDGGSAGPLRGGKGSTWEGGVRVPTLAWWPGKIAPGSACDAVAGTIDVLPTFVTLAGGKTPAAPVIDGRDISPLLLGRTKESPREAHYYFAGYNLKAVRQGPWKLAIAPQPEDMSNTNPEDSARRNPRLYNLDREIGERTNLADKHPEIVARLQALAAKTDAEIGGSNPSARRPAGEAASPRTLYPTEEPARVAKKTAASNPVSLDTLKPGDKLDGAAAPTVAGRAFTVSCTIETAQTNAIILAHGGVAAGYALHLNSGRVMFAVRTGPDAAVTEIATPAAITMPARISAVLAADGAMTLTVNAAAPVTGRSPRLIPRQPAENFCLGHDDQRPVAGYAGGHSFKGGIKELRITTP